MKQIHKITVTVFCKEEEEDCKKVRDKFKELFPFDTEKLKLLKTKSNQGFDEKIIVEFKTELEKQKLIKDFLKDLKDKLTKEHREFLIKTFDSRFNEDFQFFIRLYKPELMKGNYQITDSGDCFHIRMTVAAFPHKKENAMKNVEEIFE